MYPSYYMRKKGFPCRLQLNSLKWLSANTSLRPVFKNPMCTKHSYIQNVMYEQKKEEALIRVQKQQIPN